MGAAGGEGVDDGGAGGGEGANIRGKLGRDPVADAGEVEGGLGGMAEAAGELGVGFAFRAGDDKRAAIDGRDTGEGEAGGEEAGGGAGDPVVISPIVQVHGR